MEAIIRIQNIESGSNLPPYCDPWQRTGIPCDDLRVIETSTYSHVAGRLTWPLQVLGFIDPEGNGGPTAHRP